MSRYIDAEWLKAEFPHNEDWNYPVNTNSYVVGMIDEAPSIDLADYVPKEFHDKTCEAMAKAHQEEIADMVSVVRCKECRWWIVAMDENNSDEDYLKCSMDKWPKADDFCSYGERKEGE